MKIPGRAILVASGSGTSHMVFSGSRVFNGLSSLRDNFLSWNRSRLPWSCLTEAWQLSLHLLHVVKLWKLKKNSILNFSKTFYFDTLLVFILVSMSVHSSLSWNLFMLLMESIIRIISKVTVSKFNLFGGVNWILLLYSFIIPRVWECCQVLSASMSSRLGTMSHFRSPPSPALGTSLSDISIFEGN